MSVELTRSDCASCAALCCVAYAFDASPAFAHAKPAGEACHHLDARQRCAIHDERAARGYGGCIGFECDGVGPRVTRALVGARGLAPSAPEVVRAFLALRELVVLRAVLVRARDGAALTDAARAAIDDGLRALADALDGADVPDLDVAARAARSGAHALASLRAALGARRRGSARLVIVHAR